MKAVITGYMRLTEEQVKSIRGREDDAASEIEEFLAEGLNARDCEYRNNLGNIEVKFVEED